MTYIHSPLVSVCVPTYNSAATLGVTLDSILAQTYRNILVFVVDNASTDDTARVISEYARKDGRIRFFPNSVNIGAEGNFTRCLQLAAGEYTAIFHADDVYSESIIADEVALLQGNPRIGAVFTGAEKIDGEGRSLGLFSLPPEVPHMQELGLREVLRIVFKRGNFMVFPSAMVRTHIYKDEIKTWDAARYNTSADLDVWLRISEKHSLSFIRAPLIRYRVSQHSFSYNYARSRETRQDLFLVLDNYAAKYSGSVLRRRDMRHYRLLAAKDVTNRAINTLIAGKSGIARDSLTRDLFGFRYVFDCIISPYYYKFFVFSILILFLSFFSLGERTRGLLFKFRHGK